MRYIRGYKSFVNESKKQFDKNSLIVEKQTLNEFSNNFWNLCQNSSVFTLEEKQYISTISHTKVKLNEEWDWLDKTWDWAKEKGGKLLDSIKGKISALIKGMKNFVKSVIEFAKKLWTGLLNSAKKLGKDIATKQKDKISASMKDSKEEDKNSEWKNLIDTMKHWGYGVSAAGEVIDEKLSGATDKVVALFNNSAADAESKSIDGLNDIDLTEATANESNIFDTTEDVLIHFYNTEINESTAEATVGATQWLLNFIGSDQVKPEAKAGDKLLWWGKLLLKILSFVLSPLIKIGEEILKYTSKYVLDGLSWLTKTLGGPGAFKFVVLGGAIATVVGTATEAALLAGIHIPGWEQMEAVIHWISHALGHAIEAGIPGFDWIKILCKILGAFCLGMTLLHLYHELHHVVKGGHGEHDTHEKPEETEAKPEVKSETKPTTPSAKPEVKTETKPTTPEAKPQAKPEVKTEVKK